MLADDAAVESVAFGEGGVLASLAKGAVHLSSSTISPVTPMPHRRAHHVEIISVDFTMSVTRLLAP